MESKFHIEAWANGGCVLCGGSDRGPEYAYAHWHCLDSCSAAGVDFSAAVRLCDEYEEQAGVAVDLPPYCADADHVPSSALATARAEIERLRQSLTAEEGAHATDAKVAGRRADEAKAYRDLFNRAFTFLAGLSPHFNQPALSKEGKAERVAYTALMRELREAIKPGDK